ncbi:hypothetical protein [Burkholderia glumae]|uniref:hypothetical protein n=1 Tax=Burkholderia glumae TaxID=337 RepID=UPI00146360EF|nr:hypothetical protein [Burkholderia glumae]QJP69304.1 hypothetical protein HJC54_02610 [Burkholderia glumae]
MQIDFYAEPVDVDAVCRDLENGDVAVIHTTRPNFKDLHDAVSPLMRGSAILPLAVRDAEGGWHWYLMNGDREPRPLTEVDARVAGAIAAWQAAGRPTPYRIAAER